ncbi:threonine ammonia-lyase [Fusobacterium russii]|uniref:threonine ammonia-lyase n=1 Tax=Fusobacterium russii TaxID=854 RepID=UPI0003A158D5|nr:threonine ammonia-lyase [Fusobacterium russii]
MLNFKSIEKAYSDIKNSIKKTPLMECKTLDEMLGCETYLKLENLQKTGSFKIRGAINKIMNLTEEEKKKGVIASSAGNHAQGVALGARTAQISATIVMPETAPISKVEATKSYGARVIQCGAFYDQAYQKALEIQREEGMTFLHPFNDEYVIAGQGTIGIEILEDNKDIDIILVPVGGGGLLSGIALAAKSIKPNIKVYGVEATGAASMKKSLEENKVVGLEKCKTIADGIAVAKVGDKTFEIVKKYVDGIITVSEEEISQAILFLLEKSKVVAEGAGATALAGLLSEEIDVINKKVCCVVSGGNIDINNIEKIVNRAQIIQGRRVRFTVNLNDSFGQVNRVTEILKDHRVNILYLNQTRYNIDLDVNEQKLSVVIECKNAKHGLKVLEALRNDGFRVDEK